MKQLIEDRYIGAKVGDTIGVVDRRGFIAPNEGGSSSDMEVVMSYPVTLVIDSLYVEVVNVH